MQVRVVNLFELDREMGVRLSWCQFWSPSVNPPHGGWIHSGVCWKLQELVWLSCSKQFTTDPHTGTSVVFEEEAGRVV